MELEERIGLAEFLADLREELSKAESHAADDSLKLAVEEVSLTVDLAFTLAKVGQVSAGVRAKFWVLASAEAGAKASRSSERAHTQTLTLKLKPRVEQIAVDARGRQVILTRGVDVAGGFAAGEEQPSLPGPADS
jgi:Trypsin-co-occurring domain 2